VDGGRSGSVYHHRHPSEKSTHTRAATYVLGGALHQQLPLAAGQVGVGLSVVIIIKRVVEELRVLHWWWVCCIGSVCMVRECCGILTEEEGGGRMWGMKGAS